MNIKSGFSIFTIFFVVALLAVIGGAATLIVYRSPESPRLARDAFFSQSPAITEKEVNQSFPPLWDQVEWGNLEEGKQLFPDQEETAIEKWGYYIETTESYPIDIIDDFFNFYENVLLQDGWVFKEVGGGGLSEVRIYRKRDNYFIVMSSQQAEDLAKLQLIYSF